MGLLLVLTAVGLIALPGLTGKVGRRLRPDEWSRLCVGAVAGGAIVFELGLVLYGLPTVLRALRAPVLADACERMLGPLTPGGPVAGWAAAATSVIVAGRAARGLVRARRAEAALHIEAWIGEHERRHGVEVVVLPTDRLVALCVARPGPQVVVSAGLRSALTGDEFDAVLRHEAAHLTHRHGRLLLVASAVDHAVGFVPFARRSTAALRSAVERWADETAAGNDPKDRHTLRGALLTVAGVRAPVGVAAFSAAETVADRAVALSSPPRPSGRLSHAILYTPGLGLGGVAGVALGAWIGAARMVLAMSGRCAM